MGLKNCKECNREVSTSAKVCPHCGKKYPTGGFTVPAKIFLVLVGLVVLIRIVNSFDKFKNNKKTESTATSEQTVKPTQTASKPKEQTDTNEYAANEMVKHGWTVEPKPNFGELEPNNIEPEPQRKFFFEGETFRVGYISYHVYSSGWESSIGSYPTEFPDAKFLTVMLTVRNDDKEPRTIPPFRLIDENGAEYEISNKSWVIRNIITSLDRLNPNVEKYGCIIFDVPENHQYKLIVSGGFWSKDFAIVELSLKGKF